MAMGKHATVPQQVSPQNSCPFFDHLRVLGRTFAWPLSSLFLYLFQKKKGLHNFSESSRADKRLLCDQRHCTGQALRASEEGSSPVLLRLTKELAFSKASILPSLRAVNWLFHIYLHRTTLSHNHS